MNAQYMNMNNCGMFNICESDVETISFILLRTVVCFNKNLLLTSVKATK
jgi:hypothetical protein